MRHFRAVRISALYTCIILTLPVLVIPFALVAFQDQKGIIAAFVLGLMLCVTGLKISFFKSELELPRSLFILIGAPLFLSACVSAYIAHISWTSLWGIGFEWGTVGSFLLFLFTIPSGFLVPQRLHTLFLYGFVIAVLVAAYISAVLFWLVPNLSAGATLAGQWPDLELLIAGALLVTMIFVLCAKSKSSRSFFLASAILLFVAFLLFFEMSVALLLLAGLTVVSVFTWVCFRGIPFPSIICAAMTLLFFGFNGHSLLNLPPVGRPSLLATEMVVVPAVLESLPHTLVGTGPGTFSASWNRYRPFEFNASSLWATNIDSAYSGLITVAATLGLFGVMSFLLLPLSLMVSFVVNFHLDQTRAFFASATLAFFSFFSSFFFSTGLILFLVGGVALGFLFRSSSEDNRPTFVLRGLFATAASCALLVVGTLLLWISAHQFFGALYYAEGSASTDRTNTALLLEKGASVWPTSLYEQEASRAIFLESISTAPSNLGTAADLHAKTTKALGLADMSVWNDPLDLNSWLSRASLYIEILPLGPEDAAQKAANSLERAKALAPNRPDVPYLQAALDLKRGDISAARTHLEEALKLKPDYQDALDLLAHLNGGA